MSLSPGNSSSCSNTSSKLAVNYVRKPRARELMQRRPRGLTRSELRKGNYGSDNTPESLYQRPNGNINLLSASDCLAGECRVECPPPDSSQIWKIVAVMVTPPTTRLPLYATSRRREESERPQISTRVSTGKKCPKPLMLGPEFSQPPRV
jgi:hypothetical protein